MKTFTKLLFLLSRSDRKRAALLLFMILIMALLEMIGIASIFPFIAILSNPGLIETNLVINKLFQFSEIIGIENTQEFLFSFGILVFILFAISLTFKAFTTYLLIHFTQMCEYNLGKRLVERYLYQPYGWFLNHHSSDLGKNILSEIGEVVGRSLRPFMELIAKGMVSITIIVLLIIVNPKVALITGFSIGGIYILIFFIFRKYINQIGKERLKNNQKRFLSISEALGAIKDIKISGLEKVYINSFSKAAKNFAKYQSHNLIIGQMPKMALEGISFGGILILLLYLMKQSSNFMSVLPLISLYVFSGYRLMPAFQQIYISFTELTFSSLSLDRLYNDMKNFKIEKISNNLTKISLKKEITFKNIYFSYPNSSYPALKDINLTIPALSTVGLIGATGSGKTTMLDIILGLFEAQKGTLEVDEKKITINNSRYWQRSIGYVPQHIYLSDNTIAANIAFGVDDENIDYEAVKKVSKIANLHNFILNELPKKYYTEVGERGVRLSGGQIQRIGIARALYHEPEVLILDEATSALDNQTEKLVMEEINKLSKKLTIILVAHRLSTVKNCDKIYLFEKGQIINEGTFEELIESNKSFKNSIEKL